MKHKKMWWIVGFVCLLIVCLLACDTRMKVVHYEAETEKIQNPVRIALITDFHSCDYGENQNVLMEALHEQKPDVVLLGGDIFEDKRAHTDAEELLSVLSKQYPCYYVTGNHEYWSEEIETILGFFQKYHVTVLAGDCVTVDVRGQKFNLCGVDDPDAEVYTDAKKGFCEQLKTASESADPALFTVLLAHRPERIGTYREYGFDLVLSGHAHGGQWRLPGVINGVYAPHQGVFPKYAGGSYEFDNGTRMIVSRGLARETTIIPRIFNRPELVIIDLK